MGGAYGYRPAWMDKFESPILARLEWWKAQAQHRESLQAQQDAHEAVMAAKADALERNHQPLRKRPPVRVVNGDWFYT